MTRQVKIVAFAGSARKDSLNKKLLVTAVEGARAAGALVTVVDLKDYTLPVYCGDIEAESGLPPEALKLKAIFAENDGFLIASPEHNSGYTALLKNTIDWTSRSTGPDDPSLSAFTGKHAGILGTSPGALGALRGLYQLRELLQNNGVNVLTSMQAVSHGLAAFDEAGKIKDERTAKAVANIGAQLAERLQKILA